MLTYCNGTILHIKFDHIPMVNTLCSYHGRKKLTMNVTKKIHDSFDLSCRGNFDNAQNGKHYGHIHIPVE